MRTLVDAVRFRTLLKEECGTDEGYGEHPGKRSIGRLLQLGLVNLDKPPGPSSHDVSAIVKRILNAGKAGHAGTLEAMGRSRRIRCPASLP